MRRPTFLLLLASLTSGHLSANQADSLRNERLQEVEVKAYTPRTLSDGSGGRWYWNMESLAGMPHVLGSADPIRSLQLLPGVATNNDYSAGIHIQGCATSQSLLEMDGAPIFNASHLLGLFSVFNASHFRGMALVKNRHDAGFANRLGGRLSFYPLDSIARKPHLNATISFMESEGTLSLPAGRQSALYLSARGSYLNLLYGNLLEVDDMQLGYGLQDYNLTFVQQVGGHDKIRLSLYHGQDRMTLRPMEVASDNKLGWQNTAGALHWQHGAPRFTLHQQATFSHYHNQLDMGFNSIMLKLTSAITQAGYAGQAEWATGNVEWSGGVDYNYYHFRPMQFDISGSFIENSTPAYRKEAHEADAFLQTTLSLGTHWKMQGGVRLSAYHSQGHGYFSPGPRVTLEYRPSGTHAISLHYGLYHQYLHQLPVSHGGMPVDYWIPSSRTVRPQRANSVALGYQCHSPGGLFDLSIEAYYKKLAHQYEYTGAILDFFSQAYAPGSNIAQGKGYNYGLDIMLKKNRGRLTGWASYAIGSSRRRIPALSPTEWFNSTFDRRHDFSLVVNYDFNRHWTLGGNFVYASGTPYTPVQSMYIINTNLVGEYGKYNSANLPPTHRMDMALTYRFTPRRGCEQSLNLSVYNLYARRNVLFRYMSIEDGMVGIKHVYSLCRVLPSISYTLKF